MSKRAIFFSARPRARESENQEWLCNLRGLLVLAALLLPCALCAQVPAIADIPEDLPAPLRDPLAQARASLVQRREQLRTRVAEQKGKCSAVPEGSPQEQTCRASKAQLEAAISQYAADVRKFNDDVAAAVAAPKPQPATGPATRIGGAGAVSGTVFWVTADGREVLMKSGSPVFLNAHIRTGPNSRLQVLLLDESVFTLGPNSDMVLDEFVYDPSTSAGKVIARITKGVFRWVTGKVARPGVDRRLRLPGCVGGIRGTDVEVYLAPDESGYIKLFKGQLDITETKTGAVFSMDAGQMVALNADGTIGRPIPLRQ